MNLQRLPGSLLLATLSLFLIVTVNAQNHELSQHITKLSEWKGQADVEDYVPEMEIVGQNIHTIWVRHVSGSEGYLYYRRSTDLGETWEAPKLIHTYTNPDWSISFEHRKLSVEGEKVYIATADYNYPDNGTSRIVFYESVNAGANFAAGRVLSQNEGGYRQFYNCLIKVKNGKIAIAYQGSTSGIRKGTWFLFSSNGGANFTDTRISEESNGLSDLFFDGAQAVVLHTYSFFNNGLHTGRVWVSTTTDGKSFTTNKISPKYTTTSGESEKCLSRQFENYSTKIAKSGNNIVVVFEGNISEGVWTMLSARSTNNGLTFDAAKDLNNGAVRVETPKETVAAANGNFYIAYQSYGKDYKFYFSKSTDNGATFSQPIKLMPTDLAHVGYSNLPNIVIDPQDQSGKTFYITGNWFFSTKSTDGGNSFSHYQMLAPSLQSVMYDLSYGNCSSWMKIDSEGQKHWISKTLYRYDQISDILYRNEKKQPEPGKINKSYYVETTKDNTYKLDQIVVPDNPTIRVDSAMTTELWVRFRTGNDNQYDIISSIFTKLNGAAGYYDDTPDGYHLAFRKEKNLIQLNSGLKTDKGSFVNWSNIDLNDNLWHHVAITYDASAGKNNYKIYINGLLNKQQTVTGKVYEDVGMLILGSSNMTYSPRQIKYDIDDFRLWNKALTQDEIIGNQTAKLTGKEEGLLLFLNFDDTYKDLTGRGNDGIPVYDGRLEISDFNPPLVAFDTYQTSNEVTFTNKTKNADKWLWDFGDKNASEQGNPKHSYSASGEYQVVLKAKNATTLASTVKSVSIIGLDRIEPKESGNIGSVSINVFGGGFDKKSSFKLVKGTESILADTTQLIGSGNLLGIFNLDGKSKGEWDVVVNIGSKNYTLEKAFLIKESQYKNPTIFTTGRGVHLGNTWHKQSVTIVNEGNIDLVNVPVFVAISNNPGIEFEYINFKFATNRYWVENGKQAMVDTIQDTFILKDFFAEIEGEKTTSDAIVLPMILSRIPANSSATLHLRIKSKENYDLKAWTVGVQSNSFLKSASDETTNCVLSAASWGVTNIWADAISMIYDVPFLDCVKTTMSVVFNTGWRWYYAEEYTVTSFSKDVLAVFLNCGSDLPQFEAWKKTMQTASLGLTIAGVLIDMADCILMQNETYRRINRVLSFDPNEMVGPAGYSDKNYVKKSNVFPYRILFENKKEATAPAHFVTITDTLDLKVFDVSKFSFGAFGWSDTIITPPGNDLNKFSMDIDLRPNMQLITRVSGKLDTIKGIIQWEFLSLNPETMEYEEDPFIGFLPPNKTSPEGEGFVSFSVGLKKELKTDDEIRNKASIVFDANDPIITNEYVNTIDEEVPQSRVLPLEATNKNNFKVEWLGSDLGSGIKDYTIYVLEDDTIHYPWLVQTTETSAYFNGEVGHRYKFYSIAADHVGFTESSPAQYDAQTSIIVGNEELENTKGKLLVWPNPAKENIVVYLNNAPSGRYQIDLFNAFGLRLCSSIHNETQLMRGIEMNVSKYPAGQYLIKMTSGNKIETKKVIIK